MQRSARALLLVGAVALTSAPAARASAAPAGCSRVVIFTVPGIAWADVARWPGAGLDDAVADGAIASMSVRTVASRTSLAAGFATIGAGNRMQGGRTTGGSSSVRGSAERGTGAPARGDGLIAHDVRAAGLEELRVLAEEDDYGAVPGALGRALEPIPTAAIGNGDPGIDPPLPAGFGRWSLLAAMDAHGVVDLAATDPELLRPEPDAPFDVVTDRDAIEDAVDAVLRRPCGLTVVDQGDLSRLDRAETLVRRPLVEARRDALAASGALIGHIRRRLEPSDLLLVASPTSPAWDDDVHFGIAIAIGPGFAPGSLLSSASTRREGIVTLPDLAPTVLAHLGITRPASMQGRAVFDVPAGETDRVEAAIDLDNESVFVDRLRTPVVTAFVVLQVVVYLLTIWLLARRQSGGRTPSGWVRRSPELVALALVAFPVSTYLAGAIQTYTLGTAGFVAFLVAIDALLVAIAYALAPRSLDRLLVLSGFTTLVLLVDLAFGSKLQLNTVFSYSPLVAGRFAGLGNIAFSVLGATTLITGALVAHRWRGTRYALGGVAVLFLVVIVADGAPQLGSDVGGVIALVPGFAITWLLLAGIRPDLRLLLASGIAAVVVLGALLAFDVSQPESQRSHLARLYEDVRSGGFDVFADAISRKISTNLRVFRSTIWTYLVPPLLAAMAWLLLRPEGRWRRLATTYPRLHAGLVGALVLGVLGFAVNDSGIVIPAVILSFLVPMAVIIHLSLELQAEI